MMHLTNERHFFVGALWATIGVIVAVVLIQLLRNAPELARLLGMLVIVAWIFFWFGSDKTANVVYHIVDMLLKKKRRDRQCLK